MVSEPAAALEPDAVLATAALDVAAVELATDALWAVAAAAVEVADVAWVTGAAAALLVVAAGALDAVLATLPVEVAAGEDWEQAARTETAAVRDSMRTAVRRDTLVVAITVPLQYWVSASLPGGRGSRLASGPRYRRVCPGYACWRRLYSVGR